MPFIVSCCISQTVTLLVVQTNRYYHWCMDSIRWGTLSPTWCNSGGTVCDAGNNNTNWTLPASPNYWEKTDQLHTPFYSNIIRWNRYLHILWFLHFANRKEWQGRRKLQQTDYDNEDIFEILKKTFSKFYNLSENVETDEVIVLFRGRVIFRQYIPKSTSILASKFTKFLPYLQFMPQSQNWQRIWKDIATNCTWTIYFPSQNFLMTWQTKTLLWNC
jgi:hypothetical protein